ncbi:MAG: ComEA family DNA-binding protein [Bacteroidales bacterium]
MKLKRKLKYEYTLFTPKQRRGFVFLLIIINIIFLSRIYLKYKPDELSAEEKAVLKEFQGYIAQLKKDSLNHIKKTKINTCIRNNLQNKKRETVQKKKTKNKINKRKYSRQLFIDLNIADSIDLCKVRGIGPYTASKIVKYRKLLGGFYSIEQLKEVYGMRTKNFKRIKSQVFTKPNSIRKLKINQDSFKIILKHPYFSYELTKEIFLHRNKHDTIYSIDELQLFYSINDSILKKVKNYIEF